MVNGQMVAQAFRSLDARLWHWGTARPARTSAAGPNGNPRRTIYPRARTSLTLSPQSLPHRGMRDRDRPATWGRVRRLRRTAKRAAADPRKSGLALAAGVTDHLRGSSAPRLRLESPVPLCRRYRRPAEEAVSEGKGLNISPLRGAEGCPETAVGCGLRALHASLASRSSSEAIAHKETLALNERRVCRRALIPPREGRVASPASAEIAGWGESPESRYRFAA